LRHREKPGSRNLGVELRHPGANCSWLELISCETLRYTPKLVGRAAGYRVTLPCALELRENTFQRPTISTRPALSYRLRRNPLDSWLWALLLCCHYHWMVPSERN